MESSLKALEFDKLRDILANLAVSEAGRERITAISMSKSIAWVRAELSRVEEIRNFYERGGSFASGGLKDIRPYLHKASVQGSVLTPEELLIVLNHLRVHQTTRRILDREREKMPGIHRISRTLQAAPDLEEQIGSVLTPEATLRDRASPELSRLRKASVELQNRIRKKLSDLLPRLVKQGVLREQSFSVRDGRYVLPVRSDSLPKVKGIIHDRSATGATLFVEPVGLIDLGNELRSLELAERDEIRRILRQLSDEVRGKLDILEDNLEVITELDCLCAKARLADKLDAHSPKVTESGAIKILGGIHPLLILAGEREVIPLTLELGVDYTTLVISGPNAGGKSVALKCVGLLCVMVGCGIPVPVLPSSVLPLFDDIQADIGDQQSIIDDLSTFTAHAMRMKEIIEKSSHRTLVLIDEIGVGTDPQEGSSLSIAALEKLTENRILTIVTTHHGAMKTFAHNTAGCANGSMEFDLKTFQPTFHFRPNIPGSSYALAIAGRVGLPEDLINRARDVLGADRSNVEDLITSLSEKVQHYESLLVNENRHVKTTRALEDAYRQKIERLKVREKELKKKAKEEVESLLKEARKTVEAVVREIRESEASKESILKAHKSISRLTETVDEEPAKLKSRSRRKSKSKGSREKVPIAEAPAKKPDTVVLSDAEPRIGDKVMLDDSTTTCEVTAISSHGDRICVAVGAVQLWVSNNRVRVIAGDNSRADDKEPQVKINTSPRQHHVPFELDIRGLTADEALKMVDSYLYDGRTVGREQLGVIHGKGTGVLSKRVRELLQKHPLVESFRFGEYGEGDYGVTVVMLKK